MIIIKALEFAQHYHAWQTRKYTDEPYVFHGIRVGFMLVPLISDDAVIAAGILHDVIEDTYATESFVQEEFGPRVTEYVMDISNLHEGNRATRKRLYREQLGKSKPPVKSIKLADFLDNAPSIIQHDPNFAKVWMNEQRALLPHLKDGHPMLYMKVQKMQDEYFRK